MTYHSLTARLATISPGQNPRRSHCGWRPYSSSIIQYHPQLRLSEKKKEWGLTGLPGGPVGPVSPGVPGWPYYMYTDTNIDTGHRLQLTQDSVSYIWLTPIHNEIRFGNHDDIKYFLLQHTTKLQYWRTYINVISVEAELFTKFSKSDLKNLKI